MVINERHLQQEELEVMTTIHLDLELTCEDEPSLLDWKENSMILLRHWMLQFA